MERRFLNTSHSEAMVEDRADGSSVIVGYAARFYDPSDSGTEYRLADNMVERVAPTAFDDAIEKDDVRALFNHNPDVVLGRNRAGTLKLSIDGRGLRYEIKTPTTQVGKDVMESIRRGDVNGSSFGFVPVRAPVARSPENGVYVRTLESVNLLDVSVVTYPAYEAASAGIRSESDCQEAIEELNRMLSKSRERRLRLLEVIDQ